MRNISLKMKKQAVDKFLAELNLKLRAFHFDLDVLMVLSKRKIYKLMKLSHEAEGKTFDKNELKDLSKFIYEIANKKDNRKTIEFVYKNISDKNIFDAIDNIVEIAENILVNATGEIIRPNKTFAVTKNKTYLELGVFRL